MQYRFLTSISVALLCFLVRVDLAWSGGGETTQQVVTTPTTSSTQNSTEQATVTVPVSQSASALSLQQNGVNNFANIGTTTVPNCGGVCVYTNVRNISGNGGGLSNSQTELSAGLVWQISSPDQTNVDTQRRLADAQIGKSEDELKFSWMKELTAAIRVGNMADANGIAILLAPKLGKTPQQLLNEVMRMKL
jgi:hypothetical protein